MRSATSTSTSPASASTTGSPIPVGLLFTDRLLRGRRQRPHGFRATEQSANLLQNWSASGCGSAPMWAISSSHRPRPGTRSEWEVLGWVGTRAARCELGSGLGADVFLVGQTLIKRTWCALNRLLAPIDATFANGQPSQSRRGNNGSFMLPGTNEPGVGVRSRSPFIMRCGCHATAFTSGEKYHCHRLRRRMGQKQWQRVRFMADLQY